MRRCRFFFNVFGLELPDYLSCHQFSDSNNPDICVGQKQMRDAYNRSLKPGNKTKSYLKIVIFLIIAKIYILLRNNEKTYRNILAFLSSEEKSREKSSYQLQIF